MNLPRSTYYHKPRIVADDQALIDDIEAIIEEFSGYGYLKNFGIEGNNLFYFFRINIFSP
jgi:TusA-related sulfurtransferase